jgi:hypothetical protein
LHATDPEVAKETLAVFLSMDGNNCKEIIKLRSKTEELVEQLRTGVINKWDAICITKTLPFENKLQWIESVRLARIRFDSATVAEYLSF